MNWTLAGYKTYILAAVLAAIYFAELLELVPEGTTAQVNGIAAPLFGVTVLARVARSNTAHSLIGKLLPAFALVFLVGSLPACAAKLGPLEYEFWRGFNVDLDAKPLGALCIGCLETAPEPEPDAPPD